MIVWSAIVKRVGELHVDLVLRGADLVVDVLDRDPHRLERLDRVVAQVAGRVHRRHGEVAALVERLGAVVVLEEEVLELGADVEGVEAHRSPSARARAAGRAAGRPSYGSPSGVTTSQIIRATLWPPFGHQLEGRRVRDGDHVRLLDRVEARDRRAVEAHPVVERALELAGA